MADGQEIPQAITLPVEGMTCAACVSNLEYALKSVPGVTNAAVNLATEKALVEFASQQVSSVALEDLREAVSKAGYSVGSAKSTLAIGGMTCAACVMHVENALKRVPGVSSAVVNLATEKASVEFNTRRGGDGLVPPSSGAGRVPGGGCGRRFRRCRFRPWYRRVGTPGQGPGDSGAQIPVVVCGGGRGVTAPWDIPRFPLDRAAV